MNKQPNEYSHLALSDLWRLCKRFKKKIVATVLFTGLLGGLLALLQPTQYESEGTFREKNTKSGNMSNSIMDMFMTGNLSASTDNEAITILKSKKIIHPIIQNLNLQGSIIPEKRSDTFLNRLIDNSIITYAYLTKKNYPVLPDTHSPLRIESIIYNQEYPLQFKVLFPSTGDEYHLLGKQEKLIGKGKLNKPYIDKKFQFTLSGARLPTDETDKYLLRIWPLNLKTLDVKEKLHIENDTKDKNLLKISFRDRDRHLSKKFVNTLMRNYHTYLHDDHHRQAGLQLSYLKEKQNEAEKNLGELMFKHAFSLSEDLSNTGFADSEKEMAFLANSQHEFKERLISNELEIKRLQNVQTGKCVYYDQYARNLGDHNIINSVLEEVRDWKQQRDGLALALKKSQFSTNDHLETTFLDQQNELKEVKNQILELDQMIEAVSNKKTIKIDSKLFNNSRYTIKAWHERISQQKIDALDEENEQFLHYLYNLQRLFMVHENVIKKRLIHQQNPSSEFQGINLKTAQELYLDYSKKLNELEARKRENLFLVNQMQDDNFEITSLSTVLNDAVSNEMIQKASRLLLDLKDQNNRSDKEQNQLKEELHLERSFLLLHLQQTNQLLLLHQELVEEKINSLQNITLELIHQHISVLEKNLHDYIGTRLENLKQERLIIEQHMEDLHQEMAALPQRWVAEKMIEQNLEINELIVQEVAKMVESKNISHRLELIQSAPVDFAIMPIHPLSPHFILFSTLGMLFGGLLSMGFILKQGLSGSLPASSSNLKLLHQQVIGRFSSSYLSTKNPEINDFDLETLRRLKSYLDDPFFTGCQNWLLIEGTGPDYSADLAKLLIKNGKKTLRLFLNFEQPSVSKTGLLQFLESQVTHPTILKDEAGDYIETGGVSRFYNELLGTDTFQQLLKNLASNYDYILAVSSAQPVSANAEHLTTFFSKIAITIKNENLNQLNFYIKEMSQLNKKIGFIMTASDDRG